MIARALVDLFRSVIESAIGEQLARVYAMRLAADNARRLADQLAAQCRLIRRNAITDSLLEIVAGCEAATRQRAQDVREPHGGRRRPAG